MIYEIGFYILLAYLLIALLIAFYLENDMRKQLAFIEKKGELESLLLGSISAAILWPAVLVRLIKITIRRKIK